MGWLGILICLLFLGIWSYWSFYGWYFGDSYEYEYNGNIVHDSLLYTLLWGIPYKFVTCFMGFVCVMLLCSICPETPSKINTVYTENIYSIGVNSSVSGHFMLGAGSVDGYPTYRYFVKRNGAYQLNEIKAEQTLIFEEETGSPRVVNIQSTYYTGSTSWFKKAVFGDNEDWRVSYNNKHIKYHIYLPKGSIIQTYELRP